MGFRTEENRNTDNAPSGGIRLLVCVACGRTRRTQVEAWQQQQQQQQCYLWGVVQVGCLYVREGRRRRRLSLLGGAGGVGAVGGVPMWVWVCFLDIFKSDTRVTTRATTFVGRDRGAGTENVMFNKRVLVP